MKSYKCGSLVPGCDWHTRHDEEAEIVRRAVAHMQTAHGEGDVRADMVDRIKARIEDDKTATA